MIKPANMKKGGWNNISEEHMKDRPPAPKPTKRKPSDLPATDAQALANPKIKALVKAAILDAQLRAWERGRIDTPDEIEAAALAQLKEGQDDE